MGRADRSLSVADALETIARTVPVQPVATLAPEQSYGLVTAAPVAAMRLVPPVRLSAMDGFAVISSDTAGASAQHPVHLSVGEGHVTAGHPEIKLAPGTAVRISTGGTIPHGADCVIARERATVGRGTLVLAEPCDAGRNVRPAGEDFSPGAVIIDQARIITPAAIAAMVASGVATVPVRAMPRIALFTTGSELLDPAGLARDSNSPMIAAMGREAGVDVSLLGAVSDRIDAITSAIASARNYDMVLSSGGVSGGDYDLVRTALEQSGARILFHGLPMRPGKPVLFAVLSDGRPFFGLPGNPVAALVGFRFFVTAALRTMLGLGPEQGRVVATTAAARAGTTIFLRGTATAGHDGRVLVSTDLNQRSHVLSSVVAADCWLRVEMDDGRAIALAYPVSSALDGWHGKPPDA